VEEGREKHFLFPTQEMGAKTQNGGLVSVVLYSPGMRESTSPEDNGSEHTNWVLFIIMKYGDVT
jgi:hypothetical protein